MHKRRDEESGEDSHTPFHQAMDQGFVCKFTATRLVIMTYNISYHHELCCQIWIYGEKNTLLHLARNLYGTLSIDKVGTVAAYLGSEAVHPQSPNRTLEVLLSTFHDRWRVSWRTMQLSNSGAAVGVSVAVPYITLL